MSGGADGTDKAAESEWMQLGGKVLSIRVKRIEDGVFGTQEWRLGSWEHCEVRDMPEEPTWADFPSAAFYRDSLIAERARRVVAFFSNHRTSGTQVTLDFAAGYGRDTYEYFNHAK